MVGMLFVVVFVVRLVLGVVDLFLFLVISFLNGGAGF